MFALYFSITEAYPAAGVDAWPAGVVTNKTGKSLSIGLPDPHTWRGLHICGPFAKGTRRGEGGEMTYVGSNMAAEEGMR